MKKPSRQIREEIARLQDQLKAAETREAERIGRLALKAGLGDLEIEEDSLLAAFEEAAARFRKSGGGPKPVRAAPASEPPGTNAGKASEA
ncbi:TraC family protein (plasmid) [Nitrobacteraceae bacterium UC4446_H13]